MNTIVIDTSVLVKWVCPAGEQLLEEAEKVYQDFQNGIITILAPELLKYEFGNVMVKGKQLKKTDYEHVQEFFSALPIQFMVESTELAGLTYEMAMRMDITYYDASFLALADCHSVPLLTEDKLLYKKSSHLGTLLLRDYFAMSY